LLISTFCLSTFLTSTKKRSTEKSLENKATKQKQTAAAQQGCQIFIGKTYQNGDEYTKLPQNVPNGQCITQTTVKFSKCTLNIPRFSIPRSSKMYPNWDFWFENIPSGNPAAQWEEKQKMRKNAKIETKLGVIKSD
jgi:hypothetical protein